MVGKDIFESRYGSLFNGGYINTFLNIFTVIRTQCQDGENIAQKTKKD